MGTGGDVLLTLDVPDELFARYEWVEDGKPYREALVPSDELNPPTILDVTHDGPGDVR